MTQLLVGIVRRPHGVRGELSVDLLTEFAERLAPGASLSWEQDGRRRELRIRSARRHGTRLLLAFEGVESRDRANELAGGELTLDSERLPPAEPDFLYSHQIEGWACENVAGVFLGRARELERTAAGPMLSLERPDGGEALVPFRWPIVVNVDRQARRIVLDPPDGLLEL